MCRSRCGSWSMVQAPSVWQARKYCAGIGMAARVKRESNLCGATVVMAPSEGCWDWGVLVSGSAAECRSASAECHGPLSNICGCRTQNSVRTEASGQCVVWERGRRRYLCPLTAQAHENRGPECEGLPHKTPANRLCERKRGASQSVCRATGLQLFWGVGQGWIPPSHVLERLYTVGGGGVTSP